MRLTGWVRPEAVLTAALCALGAAVPSSAQTASPPPPQYPAYPSETPATFTPVDRRLRLRAARRDDPDARRREAAHRHPGAARAPSGAPILLTRTPYDADELTTPRAQRAPRPDPRRLRQRDRRDRRGRLHPRGPGRARQVRLRGRLRDEPAAARAAEPDAGRPRHRHLRHHRLAGEERPRDATARSASSASPTTASCR